MYNIHSQCNSGTDMKKCGMCLEVKALHNFGKFYRSKDKLYPNCKDCVHIKYLERKTQLQKYHAKNKESRNIQKHNYFKENPIHCKTCNKILEVTKRNAPTYSRKIYCSGSCKVAWHRSNNPKFKLQYCMSKEYTKERYHNNKTLYKHRHSPCARCGKEYLKKRPRTLYCGERCRINTYRAKKYQNDIKYKIEVLMRTGLGKRIRAQKSRTVKSNIGKIYNLVGCSIDDLIIHLESKFKKGMTWENHGNKGWHIDHKRPCSSFDLTDIEQRNECFHYTNLQPLWAEENMKKGNKF